jgi:phosphatidylglycerophosphate synthase
MRMIPLSIPANALTLCAFLCAVATFALCIAARSLALPAGALFAAAALAWSYRTLDDIDGPHARRTGSSGPLGEMLDHGTDAHAVYLLPLGFGWWLGLPDLVLFAVVVFASLAAWSAVWDHRHNGRFFSAPVSEVEGSLCFALVLCLAGYLGRPRMVALFYAGLSPGDLLVLLAMGAFAVEIVTRWRRVASHRREAVPLLLCFAVTGVCVLLGPSGLALPLLAGVVGARANRRMIRVRIYDSGYESWDPWAWVCVTIAAIAAFFPTRLPVDATTVPWATMLLLAAIEGFEFQRDAASLQAVPKAISPAALAHLPGRAI